MLSKYFALLLFYCFYIIQTCQAIPGNIVIDKKRIMNPKGCYNTARNTVYLENNTNGTMYAFDEENCDGEKLAIVPPTAKGKVPYAFSVSIQ